MNPVLIWMNHLMKKYWSIYLLPVLSIILWGCPYESKIPLSKPTEKIDRNLLGKWESEDEVYNSYTISPANQYEYNIVRKTTTGETHKYRGFISMIRGGYFLNAFSDSTKTYHLYRLKIDSTNNEVTVMPFSKELSKRFNDFPRSNPNDTQALNDFVWRNMNLRDFYNVEEQSVFKLVNRNSKAAN